MDLPEKAKLRDWGTQEYETDVVLLEQQGETTAPPKAARVCVPNHFCVCIRSERGQQSVGAVCSPPPKVQRRPAHPRHPENDGCAPLAGGLLQQQSPHGNRRNGFIPDGTFPWLVFTPLMGQGRNVSFTRCWRLLLLFDFFRNFSALCFWFDGVSPSRRRSSRSSQKIGSAWRSWQEILATRTQKCPNSRVCC